VKYALLLLMLFGGCVSTSQPLAPEIRSEIRGTIHDEDQGPIWQKMMKIAVKYEDYEIIEKILLVRDEVDGVMATQYSLDLFELYKQSPLFFN
jgi:hypothetical protein